MRRYKKILRNLERYIGISNTISTLSFMYKLSNANEKRVLKQKIKKSFKELKKIRNPSTFRGHINNRIIQNNNEDKFNKVVRVDLTGLLLRKLGVK